MKKAFDSLQDVDRYYLEFTAQASRLITGSQLSKNEANILFFRGIPKSQQKSIRRKLPAAQTKIQFPPPRDDILVSYRKNLTKTIYLMTLTLPIPLQIQTMKVQKKRTQKLRSTSNPCEI